MEKWEKNARSFIYNQRVKELHKAMVRYPNSEYYKQRKAEYDDLIKKLEDLEKE